MAHQVKLLPALAVVLLPLQIPANKPVRAVGDGPNVWVLATHMEDRAEIPWCWLVSGLVPAVASTWRMNQSVDAGSFAFCHSAYKITRIFFFLKSCG